MDFHNLDPTPYLDWGKPYKIEHIIAAIGRHNKLDYIDIIKKTQKKPKKLKRVCIIEAPANMWCAWLIQEKNYSLALAAPSSLETRQDIITSQSLVIGKNPSHIFKVPEVSNIKIDSGCAAIINAIWLSSTRRKGHPGAR